METPLAGSCGGGGGVGGGGGGRITSIKKLKQKTTWCTELSTQIIYQMTNLEIECGLFWTLFGDTLMKTTKKAFRGTVQFSSLQINFVTIVLPTPSYTSSWIPLFRDPCCTPLWCSGCLMVSSWVVNVERISLVGVCRLNTCPWWAFRLLAMVYEIGVCLVMLYRLQFFITSRYRISRHVLNCFLWNESILALVDLFATYVELLYSKIERTYTI